MMNVICSMVVSANGFITHKNGSKMPSKEDWAAFSRLAARYNNFIIGRKSLEESPLFYSRVAAQYKIVVSKDKNYQPPAGFIRCISPHDAINSLKGKVENALVLGGGELNYSFAEHKLIDKLILTIQPSLSAGGKKLFQSKEIASLNLKLHEVEDLGLGKLRLLYDVAYS